MLLQSKSAVQGSWPRGRSLLAAGGLLAVAVFAGGVGLRAEPPATDPKPDEPKTVIIFKADGDMPPKYIKRLIDLKSVEDGQSGKALFLFRDVEDDGQPGEKNKPAEKGKKAQGRVVIVIDSENGPVTVPIDIDSSDVSKEVEKAVQKARGEAAAARQQRSKAIEKALESLKGELNDEQIQQLRKHLEAMKATKAAGEQKRIWVQATAAPAAPGAPPKPAAPAAEIGFFRKSTVAGGGGRLGARVEPPSAALADQLDLPKGQGLVIGEVMKGSPAAKVGLAANDILLELAGKAVPSDPGQFMKRLHEIPADESVTAVVLRKGHKEKIGGIKLPEAKADDPVMLWKVDPTDGPTIHEGKVFIRQVPEGKALSPDAPSPKPAPRPDLGKYDELLLNLQLHLDDMQRTLGEDHPKIKEVRDRIEEIRKLKADAKAGAKPAEASFQRGTVILRETPDGNIIYQATPAEKNKPSPAPANSDRDMKRKLIDSEMKLKEMLGTYGPDHPQMDKMREQVARLREQIERNKAVVKPADGEKMVSVRVNDGRFEAVQSQGDVKISVSGFVDAGKASVDGIAISEGGTIKKYKQIGDVPEQYRDTVKQLISHGSPARFEYHHSEEKQPQK
jgi:hypothetical protein